MTSSRALRCTLAVTLIAGVLGGCGGSATSTKPSAVRGNLTPNMSSLNQRPQDVDNMVALTFNTQKRERRADWYRLALLDRPSRLSYIPIPH